MLRIVNQALTFDDVTLAPKYSEILPNITTKKEPPKDNDKYKNEENKFEKYFKENL